ncbi:MAG TPA: MJ0042-type zinc finger domain-containing protein, partial [Pseudomonadales bacterium]|nr:MJ0042-type zinc finger domain-containing protein [Pseudomonadales bacterium]
MTTIQKTKCPHCGSLFQVSEQQLQIANGTVRCGNCSNIFQAEDHLVESKQTLFSTASLYEQSSLSRDIEEVDESWALELLKELEAEEAASNPASADSPQNKANSPETQRPAPELPVLQNTQPEKAKPIESFS